MNNKTQLTLLKWTLIVVSANSLMGALLAWSYMSHWAGAIYSVISAVTVGLCLRIWVWAIDLHEEIERFNEHADNLHKQIQESLRPK